MFPSQSATEDRIHGFSSSEALERDALFAAGVATGSYLLFVRVLNVTLPAGLLARWL